MTLGNRRSLLEGGARTKRLDPGQSQRLDLGVITSSPPELSCTLPGHKSAGMTLDIQIQDRADTASRAPRAHCARAKGRSAKARSRVARSGSASGRSVRRRPSPLRLARRARQRPPARPRVVRVTWLPRGAGTYSARWSTACRRASDTGARARRKRSRGVARRRTIGTVNEEFAIVREILAAARERGLGFELAWARAIRGRTPAAREALEATRGAWERAYRGERQETWEVAVRRLVEWLNEPEARVPAHRGRLVA
jgi:hypothetical protein